MIVVIVVDFVMVVMVVMVVVVVVDGGAALRNKLDHVCDRKHVAGGPAFRLEFLFGVF